MVPPDRELVISNEVANIFVTGNFNTSQACQTDLCSPASVSRYTSLAIKLPFPALHDDDSPNWLNLRSAVGPLRHAPPFWIANTGTKNVTLVFSYVMSIHSLA